MDLYGGWLGVIGHYCPNADVCADPFHVIKLAGVRTSVQKLKDASRPSWTDWI